MILPIPLRWGFGRLRSRVALQAGILPVERHPWHVAPAAALVFLAACLLPQWHPRTESPPHQEACSCLQVITSSLDMGTMELFRKYCDPFSLYM